MRYRIGSWLALFLVCASAVAGPRPQRGHDGDIDWVTLETAESSRRTWPMLVYFGAAWCAPCKVLETQVFNQPEVRRAMDRLIPVYVDGDRDNASALMERFKVVVFPTLLVIDVDGREKGRFVGSSEKAEMLAFLRTSTAPETPASLLEAFVAGKTLTAGQWQMLSGIYVLDAGTAKFIDEDASRALALKRDNLSKALAAARKDPALPDTVEWVLGVKLLLLDATGDKPKDRIPEHHAALAAVLDQPGLQVLLRQELIEYAEAFLDYLEPEAGDARTTLARRLVTALEHLYTHPDTTPAWKLAILDTELALLPMASDDRDADKTRFAERVEAELSKADTPAKRLAVAQTAARILRMTGRELRGEAVLRETLEASPEAYYLLSTLAAYAKLRGDMEAHLSLSEQAYRRSLRHAPGIAQGAAWVSSLIASSPTDAERIASATGEVLQRAAAEGDAYLAWGGETMKRMANDLGMWMTTGAMPGASVASRIAADFKALCRSLNTDAVQVQACEGDVARLAKPEAPPANT